MSQRPRRSKVKTAKDIVRNLSIPARVEVSSVVPNCSVGHQVDINTAELDLDGHLSALEAWHPNFTSPQDPGSSQVVVFGQSDSNLSSGWVMVSNNPEHGLADSLATPAGLSKPLEQKGLAASAPSLSMRPPELRPKSKSPRSKELQPHVERASSTKRMPTSDPDVASLLKRTRQDPSQAQQHKFEDGADDDDEDDESNRVSTPKARDQHAEESDKSLSFACPYYRLNPVAHQQCLSYTLKRIRDMKQHLARRHYDPRFYCPTCQRSFPSMEMMVEHIRCGSSGCVPRSSPASNLDGVSPRAQDLLKQRADRNASAEEQWHAVYEILFGKPGTGRIDPYIRGMVRETLGIVRAFLRATGSIIIPRVLDSHPTNDKETEIVNIIDGVFTEVEVEFDNKTDNRQMTRFTSGRSTESGTSTRESPPAHRRIKSEERAVAAARRFSATQMSGRAGSRHQASPKIKSHTFPGPYDVPYSPSPSSISDVSSSWPSLFLPLVDHSTFGIQQNFNNHNECYVPSVQDSPLDFPIAGFTDSPSVFSATPTICDTASNLATDFSWHDNDNTLTGVGGSFRDTEFEVYPYISS